MLAKTYTVHTVDITHISVLHSDRDDRGQNVKSLSHYSPGLQRMCLEKTMEHLKYYPLVDGKSSYDVGQQEMSVVLGSWVLEEGGERDYD